METLDDVLKDVEQKMGKCEEHLKAEFSGIRTGRASPAMVDGIVVPYYGSPTPLQQIANISVPEPRLIVINAYDPSVLREIEKAIVGANLGVTPMNDGKVIRVPIPEMSEERRGEMTKVAKRMAEDCRVAVRNVRRDGNELIKQMQKDNKLTEDDRDLGTKKIQEKTDAHIANVDKDLEAKTNEIMEV